MTWFKLHFDNICDRLNLQGFIVKGSYDYTIPLNDTGYKFTMNIDILSFPSNVHTINYIETVSV